PVARVGKGVDHHDTISPQVLYVLVDKPKGPDDTVILGHGTRQWPPMFTTHAEPLYDSLLVFAIPFEETAESGKFSLTLKRGEEPSVATLFSDVPAKDLFLDDADLPFDDRCAPANEIPTNKRWLDYNVIELRPPIDDDDLDWPEGPYASITEG